jgi:hypothetical protein
MKPWIAVLLLGTYLLTCTELHQLLKLPALFAHFTEHCAQDSDESFVGFLGEHYFGGRHHGPIDQHDQELPFHGDHTCAAQSPQLSTPTVVSVHLCIARCIVDVAAPGDDRLPSSQPRTDIWQPPRV